MNNHNKYNYRYNDGEIVMIDVSQAVEHEHPYALEFLRKDCTNITGKYKFFLNRYCFDNYSTCNFFQNFSVIMMLVH